MKVKTLVDIKIECDPPNMRWHGDMERQAKAMESWAKEFNAFIRDHRSQDAVSLSVHRVYETLCSHCKLTYEEDSEGPLCCNAAIAEWEALKVKVPA